VMGAPGKVVRELTEQQIQMITGPAHHYAENWKRYAKGLKKIG
jgi:carbonic anhydrase/acetyltransferase-like protein (isoleucine patch superfamily)